MYRLAFIFNSFAIYPASWLCNELNQWTKLQHNLVASHQSTCFLLPLGCSLVGTICKRQVWFQGEIRFICKMYGRPSSFSEYQMELDILKLHAWLHRQRRAEISKRKKNTNLNTSLSHLVKAV